LVHAGNASAQAIYSSGGDLVILANQTMSIANVPVADLAITKSHTGNFTVGINGVYTLNVTNNGPSPTTGTITVTDTLPTGLTYVSATGTGWTCGAVGQVVTCTRPSPLNSGVAAPAITLTVSVAMAASPSVTNTATVSSGAFDNIAANNTASDVTTVVIRPVLTVVKSASPGPSVNPGGVVTYTILVTNTGAGTATSVIATDFVPTYTAYVTNSTRLNSITVAGDGSTLPLIAGLLLDDNVSRGAGVAATGILPAGKSATITFQMTVK
jgi:uncharacterized repeat protein (TIGR01451 family)